MAQTFNQTVNTKFNKGLLTEYSELTFPEDASVDELNCDLHKAGNRTKRKGITFEDDHLLSVESYPSGILYHTTSWENVGNNADIEYLVVQVGSILRFYRKGTFPLSDGVVPTSVNDSNAAIIDMTQYEDPSGLGAGASRVDVTSINGYLIVASPQINTFYIKYEKSDQSFTTQEINFRIRDFLYFSDITERHLAIPTGSVSIQRTYDTQNSGWVKPPRDTYISTEGKWPPLTHPWYSGKDQNGAFSVGEWNKVAGGSSLIANGTNVIGIWDGARKAPDGTIFYDDWKGEPIEVPSGRFNTVETYAGRAWYSGIDSRVYYSQILENIEQIGLCHSQNDPTAEYASDVLATDGGYIILPEANGIKKLHVFGSSLLVFADNGVWRISGSDGNLFEADDFSVYKVTDVGLAFRDSFVGAQNAVPFWWSYLGIHTISVTEDGGMVEMNLSRETIQSFWENIGSDERGFVTAIYDAFDNKVLWLYPNHGEDVEYKVNNVLILDIDLGAFYPWKVSDETGLQSPYIVGASFFDGKGSSSRVFNVVDSQGRQVVDSQGNELVVSQSTGTLSSSNVYFLTRTIEGKLTFSLFKDIDFVDWGDADYEAYAESNYNFIGDLGRRKNSPYITVFMRETEIGFVADGFGNYTAVNPSSLSVKVYWDFQKKCSCKHQEAYRHKLPIFVGSDLDDFPSPTTVIATRLKLRGRGRSMRIRFEGKKGHDFNLLGWETLDARKGGY